VVAEEAAMAERSKGVARRRLGWLAGLVLTTPFWTTLGRADAQLFTAHLPTDAAAIALASDNGGAIRFTTEVRIGQDGEPALSVRLRPFGDEGEKEGSDDRPPKWPSAVPVPFSLSYDGQGTVTFAVTVQGKILTAHNDRDLRIAGDFTDLFLRARVKGAGTGIAVADLLIDGLLVGDGAAASDPGKDEKGSLDILRVTGSRLTGGFRLSGHITATWRGEKPEDALLSVMIWGARIVGHQPSDRPPLVSILQPAPDSFLASARPVIAGSFLGADPASVRLLVDGVDRTAQAQAAPAVITFTPAVPFADGTHQALVFARKPSGVSAQALTRFTVDTSPPKLAITAPSSAVIRDNPAPAIAVTFADALSGFDPTSLVVAVDGAVLTSRCQVGAAAAACQPPPLGAGDHLLTVQGRDRAGNSATQSFAFKLVYDTTPPSLAITAPTQPLVVGSPSPVIRLAYSDAESGVDVSSLQVLVDQQDVTASCTAGAATAQCQPPPLRRGAHSVSARISDRRGNRASATAAFDLALPVAIAFTAPKPEQLTGVAAVRVAGTVAATATSVQVNGVTANLSAGAFSIDSLGLHEGINNLVAVAQDAQGNVGTAAVRVIVDTTPPRVSFSYPRDGAAVGSASLTVTGLVNDLTVGTVNQTQASVTVNGVAALVAHRSFVATGVPLAPGSNQLVAVATDRVGNHATATIHVTLAQPPGALTIRAVSGDGQSGTVSAALAAPLTVAVTDAAGGPLASTPVVFRVAQGNGTLQGGGRSVLVRTDAQGRAATAWTLGNRAGAAVNRVRATAAGVPGEASFYAQAAPGAPAAVYVASGDDQNGAVGTDLAQAFFAVVTDAGDNPVAGVPVTFKVVLGGGSLSGAPSQTVPTDDSGMATARLALGPLAGLDNNRVEATVAAVATPPATFKASAFELGDPAQTRVAGMVLDNQGLAVPGVTIRLRDSSLTTETDAGGQFRMAGVPVGQLFLIADASTAARPGSWASLEYELFALAGIENHLPKPIYILPLALAAGVFVDETHGGSVKIPGIPGFALDVAPGSVTFPGGGRNGTVSVTAVHGDKIPMPPGAGMQPRLIVTIQPAGARFEPPARLSLPNVDGRPPGSVTELFSFEHGIGAFVSVGTGTVSEDGLVLQSDPGFGVVEAGWHCGAPASATGDAEQIHVHITDVQALTSLRRLQPRDGLAVAPKQVFLCSDKLCASGTDCHDSAELTATGGPSSGASYDWEVVPITGTGVLSLKPSGANLCFDQSSCKTEATAGNQGFAQAKVTVTKQDATDSDSAEVSVARLLFLSSDAQQPRSGSCYLATTNQDPAQNTVTVTADLDPEITLDSGDEAAAAGLARFITWGGVFEQPADPALEPLQRRMRRDVPGEFQISARTACGGPDHRLALTVIDPAPLPSPPLSPDISLVAGGEAQVGTGSGFVLFDIGQPIGGGKVTQAPAVGYQVYLDGNVWRLRITNINFTYYVGFNQRTQAVQDYVNCRVAHFRDAWTQGMQSVRSAIENPNFDVPFNCDDVATHDRKSVVDGKKDEITRMIVDRHTAIAQADQQSTACGSPP
jgi:hypothetical protein